MKSGLKPVSKDRRDFDLFANRSHKLAGITTIPDSYSVNARLRIPNQEQQDNNFTPPVPPLPFGCTDYSQCELLADEDGRLFNPMDIENITHANANGGGDLRVALKTVTKLHPEHPSFFNITPTGPMDAFDAARLAMLVGANEKRGVSVGSPFWHEWSAVGPSGKLPPPSYDLSFASWHNWVVKGWDTLGDGVGTVTYLICQMLQGPEFGNHGFVYMPREQFNATMAVKGSAMFTLDKLLPGEQPQTIGSPLLQEIVNFIRSIWGGS